jgi:Trp operon repressor
MTPRTWSQRDVSAWALLSLEYTQRQISAMYGVSQATVSIELKRMELRLTGSYVPKPRHRISSS